MSDRCLTCGGLILDPGVAYGYAGPICYCSEAQRIRTRASEYRTSGLDQFNQKLIAENYIAEIEALKLEVDRLKAKLERANLKIEKMTKQDFQEMMKTGLYEAESKLAKAKEALEFYADKDGEHWAACRPDDTADTCCHMICENKGGDIARAALKEIS